MSAWEAPPSATDVADMERDGDFDDYMADVYRGLRDASRERALHNRDGFYADLAGGVGCLAAGHVEPDAGWDYDPDGQHPWGWSGDYLCSATRYGSCCTECEGKCSEPDVLAMSTRAEFWALVSEPAGS